MLTPFSLYLHPHYDSSPFSSSWLFYLLRNSATFFPAFSLIFPASSYQFQVLCVLPMPPKCSPQLLPRTPIPSLRSTNLCSKLTVESLRNCSSSIEISRWFCVPVSMELQPKAVPRAFCQPVDDIHTGPQKTIHKISLLTTNAAISSKFADLFR